MAGDLLTELAVSCCGEGRQGRFWVRNCCFLLRPVGSAAGCPAGAAVSPPCSRQVWCFTNALSLSSWLGPGCLQVERQRSEMQRLQVDHLMPDASVSADDK